MCACVDVCVLERGKENGSERESKIKKLCMEAFTYMLVCVCVCIPERTLSGSKLLTPQAESS